MEEETVALKPIVEDSKSSTKKRKRKGEEKKKDKKKRKSTAEPSESPSSPKKEKKSKKEKKGKKEKKKASKKISDDEQPAPEPIKETPVVKDSPAMPFMSKQQMEALKSNINTGINFDSYDNIPIEVTPAIFDPIEKFADAKLGDALQRIIDLIGYNKPTPVQKHALPIIMGGRDLMASAQTGSGKTAAFLFPIIANILNNDYRKGKPKTEGWGRSCCAYPLAVVLAPTRELAVQIFEETRKFTTCTRLIPIVLYGGVPYTPQARQVERGVDIVIATPGRLHDMVERGKLSLSQVQFLCLDEADRMLDMGFEPQIRTIVEQKDMPKERRTVMFSATFPKQIQRLATDFLARNYIMLKVGRVGSATDSIVQKIRAVADIRQKMAFILEELKALTDEGRVMVFVETKRSAAKLGTDLRTQGFRVATIHGDCTQPERETALRSFRVGKVNVLIGTSVAARGLDIDNVTHVINYDLPDNIDDYVHRIGRTGRAGNTGLATAFFNPTGDRNLAKPMVKLLREAKQLVPEWLQLEAVKPRVKGTMRGRRGGGGAFGRWVGNGGGGRNSRPGRVPMKGGRRGGGGGRR